MNSVSINIDEDSYKFSVYSENDELLSAFGSAVDGIRSHLRGSRALLLAQVILYWCDEDTREDGPPAELAIACARFINSKVPPEAT